MTTNPISDTRLDELIAFFDSHPSPSTQAECDAVAALTELIALRAAGNSLAIAELEAVAHMLRSSANYPLKNVGDAFVFMHADIVRVDDRLKALRSERPAAPPMPEAAASGEEVLCELREWVDARSKKEAGGDSYARARWQMLREVYDEIDARAALPIASGPPQREAVDADVYIPRRSNASGSTTGEVYGSPGLVAAAQAVLDNAGDVHIDLVEGTEHYRICAIKVDAMRVALAESAAAGQGDEVARLRDQLAAAQKWMHEAIRQRDAAIAERDKYRSAANVLCGAHIGVPQSSCPVCERDQLRAATPATSEARAAEIDEALMEYASAVAEMERCESLQLGASRKGPAAVRHGAARRDVLALMRSAPAAPGAEAVLLKLRERLSKFNTTEWTRLQRAVLMVVFAEIDKLLPPGNAAPGETP